MSTIFPVDHHATFQGTITDNPENTARREAWSRRQSVGFILISALASWILVLAPFLLLR